MSEKKCEWCRDVFSMHTIQQWNQCQRSLYHKDDLKETEPKLFYIELDGMHVPYRTEYLKGKSKEFVEKTILDSAKYETSEYYGYTEITVKQVKEVSVPELRTMEIDTSKFTTTIIKTLENKIAYHSKIIKGIKEQIHEERGDYDNKEKYNFGGICITHDNCEFYLKVNSTKIIHRKIKLNLNFKQQITLARNQQAVRQFSSLPAKFCAKPVVNDVCDGLSESCKIHYKCNICGGVHLTKKETKRKSQKK